MTCCWLGGRTPLATPNGLTTAGSAMRSASISAFAAVMMVAMARSKRRRWRPLRSLRRLSRLQWVLVAAITLAVVAGSASLTLLLRGPAPPLPYPATVASPSLGSAPIATPTGGLPQSTSSATGPASLSVTARLVIPAGGINIQVIQGNGTTIPMDLAMHYPGTAWPGQGSNSVFYAHGQAGMFLGLYSLHLGDEVEAIQADGGELDYTVSGFERVPYNDFNVLDSTSFDQITLLTCTSYNPYTDRFIVLATPS